LTGGAGGTATIRQGPPKRKKKEIRRSLKIGRKTEEGEREAKHIILAKKKGKERLRIFQVAS